ncbi:voltage-dependent T-type calcium channel subunit alpha-1I-like [Pseudoliparis swirei]|uniref:voltage-dependent T-type calcium channel subunit alpha-1I-like n=1 Tax=Pseudoliparis swirei TaxID=2059687 RepID=UPI0024BECF93|nr:voltage-dependent T-type calcium channel subunit alpha-1I-like [Pseudoliparis swirei]
MTEVAVIIPQLGDPSPPSVTSVQEQLPDPVLVPVVIGWFPRNWCLQIAVLTLTSSSTWLEYVSILFVFLNCMSLGMSEPGPEKSYTFEIVDTLVVAFFLIEMLIKILAMGFLDCPGSYVQNKWNTFDVFINVGELLSYSMQHLGFDMTMFQVLGPMRLISRVASMRDVMSVLMGILPVLVNVLLLYMFVIEIFAVMGVQLWAGQLRNRCFPGENISTVHNVSLDPYFMTKRDDKYPFICSLDSMKGTRRCRDVPPLSENGQTCSLAPPHNAPGALGPVVPGAAANACVNWNVLYNICRAGDQNPNKGAINFDNIGYAWLAMFQVITLEGWSAIMFNVMDASSFWSFLFFIIVTVMGSFIMMNVCAVVIGTHFSDKLGTMSDRQSERRAADKAVIKGLYVKLTSCLKGIRRAYSRTRNNRVHSSDSGTISTPVRVDHFPHFHQQRCRCLGDKRSPDSTAVFQIGIEICRPLRVLLTRVVKSPIFDRVIMFAVLLSILIMAIEHHEQPVALTTMLGVSNMVFTVVFVVEMALKLVALRWTYFKDKDNCFDFVIVIVSLWETITKANGKLSVLRVFRLLRFGRLLHFLPHLRKQLLVLKKAMVEAAPLCSIMLFLIFIFSVIGRYLFGNQIDVKISEDSDRKCFDTLLWSMVTVFQVLTEEDWQLVLYNTMAATSPWAAIYFVAIILTGKHILLNVLVGIVIQGFQDRRDKNRSSDPDSCQPAGSSSANVTPDDPVSSAAAGEDNIPLTRIQKALRWCKEHEDWSLYALSPQNRFRIFCQSVIATQMFNYTVLLFILLNCVTIALERPGIHPGSVEQLLLNTSSYVFSVVFLVEMIFKVLALGLVFGSESYCRSNWNKVDGSLVVLSLVHILVSLVSPGPDKMLVVVKVLRLLRTFRPLRVVKRAPKLKLAVQALILAIRPIGNIFLICCAFLFFYAILGVQLFKGKFYTCFGENLDHITNKTDCLSADYRWERNYLNFDSLPQALLALFVMYSRDGWVIIMRNGVDAVGVNAQPVMNYNEWALIFFLTFIILSFFLLDMFIGVMVDTFREVQYKQLMRDIAEGRVVQVKGRELVGAAGSCWELVGAVGESDSMSYCTSYSRTRRWIHTLCTNTYLDLFMGVIIFISVLIMSVEHYGQPPYIAMLTEYSHDVFTVILIIEVLLKLVAFGGRRFMKNRWNLLDLVVILVSVSGIVLNKMYLAKSVPFNPGILRVCRVLRLAQVLKAPKIRVLLKTVIKTLTQVGNICLLFIFFFYIYAALGVELFGTLGCVDKDECRGLNDHSNFKNFGMALLALYQVCTGDNWSRIMKDTMTQCRLGDEKCSNYLTWVSPIYFITFVVTAQFVLVNLVVGVIMQAMEDSKREELLAAGAPVLSPPVENEDRLPDPE